MANSDVTLVMEKSEEKAARDSDSESEFSKLYSDSSTDNTGESSLEDWPISREKWPRTVRILDHMCLLFHWILANWKKMFVTSCVSAVSLDPLFLYIPIINQDRNCLELDKNLEITAVILRSATDLFYIMDIIIQIYKSDINYSRLKNKFPHSSRLQLLWNSFLPEIATMISQSYILIDVLAILPIPQVLILIFFSRMRGSRSLNTRRYVINFSIMMQYIPRVFRIYLSCKEPKKSPKGQNQAPKTQTPIWVKGVLNFFMYILASHVLGAVWYFFAIQRMTVCWQHACRNEKGCDSRAFSCYDRSLRNTTFLNNLCPISPADAAVFDFGIFLGVLQSGMPWSTNFLQKFSNCFCWGLRNLSSLGSNLQPSTNTWENLFVVFISVIGLLLFIYLIGNLQTYLSLDTARIEEHRHKMKIKRKMEEKGEEIELWLPKNGIPEKSKKDIKGQIMEKVEQEFQENRDVDLDNFLSILPLDLENQIKSCMPFTRLKKVRALQNMDEQVLKAICDHLKPVKYAKNKVIIREGEPLKMMFFIVEGKVTIKKKDGHDGSTTLQQGAGELYGEKLLAWPFSSSFPDTVPTATESATTAAAGDVEVLILMANDMKSVGSTFRMHFNKKYGKLKEILANHLRPDETAIFVEAAPIIFSAQELKKATKNYQGSRMLGAGGYATVYKGRLPDKTVVAVKKSKGHAGPGQIVNEAFVLSQINHKNVVRLLGCCLETNVPILVYEFINNGTLFEHIHRRQEGSTTAVLSLELRIKIAVQVAEALAYLHSGPKSIIHQDVTTKNILLDDNFTAKLVDFGASRLLHQEDQEHFLTTVVHGTLGYLDPEYFLTSILTEKSDVYSFGVVLVELLTSRTAVSVYRSLAERSLANFFIYSKKKGRLDHILDREIINEEDQGCFEIVLKVCHLAERCLRLRSAERPLMIEVATALKGVLRAIANPGEQLQRDNFSQSHKDLSDYWLRSPSNSYIVDVRDNSAGSSATEDDISIDSLNL